MMYMPSRVNSPLAGPCGNGIPMDICLMLPMLQAKLVKYGATYVPEKVVVTNRGQSPSWYGNTSGGRGGMRGPGYGSGCQGRNSRHS